MEMHFVDNFTTNLLINNDIFNFNGLLLIMAKKPPFSGFVRISSFLLKFTRAFFNAKRIIRIKSIITILQFAIIQMPVIYKNSIPTDRDFLFEPECYQNFGNENGIFAHVVEAHLSFIKIYNVSVFLPDKTRFD